jgi:hypothetical protein
MGHTRWNNKGVQIATGTKRAEDKRKSDPDAVPLFDILEPFFFRIERSTLKYPDVQTERHEDIHQEQGYLLISTQHNICN